MSYREFEIPFADPLTLRMALQIWPSRLILRVTAAARVHGSCIHFNKAKSWQAIEANMVRWVLPYPMTLAEHAVSTKCINCGRYMADHPLLAIDREWEIVVNVHEAKTLLRIEVDDA